MGLFDVLKQIKDGGRRRKKIEEAREISRKYAEMREIQMREAREQADLMARRHNEVEQTRKATGPAKYQNKAFELSDHEAAAAAGLPEPDSEGRIQPDRFENSNAVIGTSKPREYRSGKQTSWQDLPAFPRMPVPKKSSLGMLTEEVPSTISIDSIVEMPRSRRHTEELRHREAELAALSEFLDRSELISPDPLSIFKKKRYEDSQYYATVKEINDRSLPREERLKGIMEIVENELIKASEIGRHTYDPDHAGNKAHVKDISELLLDDMDKTNVSIDLDELKTNGYMSPEFMLYRRAVSAAAKSGIDMGIRINPIYHKMKALEEKGSSTGIFSRISFRSLVVAAGARINWRMGSFLRPYEDDPGAAETAKASAYLMFVEKATPSWILADTLAMAYEVYDLSGKWVDDLPYFMMTGLPEYMKKKYPGYPDEFPLKSGREEALAAAYMEAGEIKCCDCEKAIQKDEVVFTARRTYGGATGAESHYCPECAEKFLEEMSSYEKEGRLSIIYTEADEPDLGRELNA